MEALDTPTIALQVNPITKLYTELHTKIEVYQSTEVICN